jgi:hypothetical protein
MAALIAPLAPVVAPELALAAATVTGGVDTTIAATSAIWTTIPDLVIAETASDHIGTGTIILTTPSNFRFNSGASASTSGTGCMTIDPLSSTTPRQLQVNVTAVSSGTCSITITGLQVQPASTSLGELAALGGPITNTGTASNVPASGYGTLTETSGPPAGLAFSTQPAFGTTNSTDGAFQTQPTVKVVDAVGNRVFSDSSTLVTLGIDTKPAGSPVLACSPGTNQQTAVAGLAVFSGCKINLAGLAYRLSATSGTWTTGPSSPFDVADSIAFSETPPPTGSRSGVEFTAQPVVQIKANGLLAVNTSTGSVSLSIGTSSVAGAILSCAVSPATPVGGTATFAGCRIFKAANYTLGATVGGLSTLSSSFEVAAGPAKKVVFLQQPTAATANSPFALQPIVAITDSVGDVVTTGVTARVTISIGANPGAPAGSLTCTPGTTVVTQTSGATAGQGVFAGCAISSAGAGYTLIATPSNIVCASSGPTGACAASGVLTAAVSSPLTVTAAAAQITLTTSAPTVTWGSLSHIRTQFASNGAGKTFNIEASRDGVTWAVIATRVADASGSDVFSDRPMTNTWYRADFTGAGDLTAGISKPARVLVRQTAVLRPTNHGRIKVVSAQTKVTFTLTVRPVERDLPKALVTFRIYRSVSRHWILYSKRDVYVNAAGRVSFTWQFSTRGEWYVRAIANQNLYNSNSAWTPIERYSVH